MIMKVLLPHLATLLQQMNTRPQFLMIIILFFYAHLIPPSLLHLAPFRSRIAIIILFYFISSPETICIRHNFFFLLRRDKKKIEKNNNARIFAPERTQIHIFAIFFLLSSYRRSRMSLHSLHFHQQYTHTHRATLLRFLLLPIPLMR